MSTAVSMTTPPIVAFAGQQAQAARDVNTASLCRIGQETVQDIVLRTMEIFQLLRNMQLPNGVTYHPSTHQDRLGKLQEHLRMLSVLFRKLRLVYDKCNENCTGLDPVPPEQLIPYVEDDSSKHDERLASQARPATEERREILEVNKQSSVFLLTLSCRGGNQLLSEPRSPQAVCECVLFWCVCVRKCLCVRDR
uniref:Mediator of RNA polymerase II transcription subunit 30 n=1 Tax=Oncorhynchus kisutch TaxID=8019 RepID=A0A8C7FY46_ONCKI